MGETVSNPSQSPPHHAKCGRAGRPVAKGEFSLGGTLGAGAGTAYRILRGTPGRNQRLLRGVRASIRGFAGPVRKVLHVLFLEVSGLVFLLISVSVISSFLHEYRKYAMHEVGVERVIVIGIVGAMFLYFAVSSFWRARRRSKV